MLYLLPRAVLLLIIISDAFKGDLTSVTMNGVVFLLTLPFAFLGKEKAEWRRVEIALMVLFALYPLIWMIPSASLSDGTLFGADKLFHLAGGFCLGLVGLAIFARKLKGWYLAIAAVAVAVTIGTGWEVFEYFLSMPPFAMEHHGLGDTMLDFIADGVGACLASGIYAPRTFK